MLSSVYVTSVVEHFLGIWLELLQLARRFVTYPEIPHCIFVVWICGSDETVVVQIGRFS